MNGLIKLPAGVFAINEPIWLGDGVTVEGVPDKTIIRKVGTPFGHVFCNLAATDMGRSWNKNITLKNLIIDENNNEVVHSESGFSTRGLCQFTYVSGLTVENVKFINAGPIQYGFHLQSVIEARFKNIDYRGHKTLCQMQAGCSDIEVDGWVHQGGDDSFALNAADWVGDSHRVGDIADIKIKNGKILPYSNVSKNVVRFLPGSWAPWKAGNSYRISDYCVNDGNIYQMVNRETIIASDPPIHTYETKKGQDGIAWQWLQEGERTTANVRRVMVDGVEIADARQFGMSVVEGPDMRPEYPGTEGTSVVSDVAIRNVNLLSQYPGTPLLNISGGHTENLLLENVDSTAYYRALSVGHGVHNDITVRNVDMFTGTRQPLVVQGTKLGLLKIDDCRFNGSPSLLVPLNEYLLTDGSISKIQVGSRIKL